MQLALKTCTRHTAKPADEKRCPLCQSRCPPVCRRLHCSLSSLRRGPSSQFPWLLALLLFLQLTGE